MNTPRALSIIAIVLLLVCGTALASPRVVLLETFTNTSCAECFNANDTTHDFVSDWGSGLVLNIQYHTNAPSIFDPFYQANTTDHMGRAGDYAFASTPVLYTDGVKDPVPADAQALHEAIGRRLAVESPLTISVTTNLVGDQLTVDAEITATDAVPSGSLVVHTAFVEPYVHYATAPGSNGEQDFYCTMRDMLPTWAGSSLAISNGQTVYTSETGTLDPAWQDVYAIVWVQNTATGEVLQAAASIAPTASDSFYFGHSPATSVAPLGEEFVYDAVIRNTGSDQADCTVRIMHTLPANWVSNVCANGQCYQSFVRSFPMVLAPGEEKTISVEMQPYLDSGQGWTTLTAESDLDPTKIWSQDFKVISDDVKILCIDGDGGQDYETLYHDALTEVGFPYGTWDVETDGKAEQTMLGKFHTVVWNVGENTPTLDEEDRNALAVFLTGNGNLFLTGQDIGCDMFCGGSANASAGAQSWYNYFLGADYVSDDVGQTAVTGVAADVIGDGLSFSIAGGTGADNQDYPSEIAAWGTGVGCVQYGSGQLAGVHNTNGTFKTVYFAFGFEGIADAADRTEVMDSVLDWFGVEFAPVDEDNAPDFLQSTVSAIPNPFNPATRIEFSVGGESSAAVSVAIYDLRGQRVRDLFDGVLPAGRQGLNWNGRADSGRSVASGAYVARVTVDGQTRIVKMTLAR